MDERTPEGNEPDEQTGEFDALLEYLRQERGFDFTGYKRTSIARRIQRRMKMLQIESFATYREYLQVRADEFQILFNTILINVTGFFRDPAAWESLSSHMARIIETKRPGDPIRVWSAGCAGGQEAYTLAMLLCELMGTQSFTERVKIYATDLDEGALAEARQATYPADALEQAPQGLAEKYFQSVNGRLTFKKELRRAVIFGRHDLVHDAPISRVDILVCRNTLMYFNAETQARILGRLHFALTSHGVLLLGKAETLLTYTQLFTPIDLKLRLFARAPKSKPREGNGNGNGAHDGESPLVSDPFGRLRSAAFEMSSTAQVILDAGGYIAMVNHRAASFLPISKKDIGKPFHEVDLSYHPIELRLVIDRALLDRKSVRLKDQEWTRPDGTSTYLDIDVVPLVDAHDASGVAIIFVDATAANAMQSELKKINVELQTSHEELRSTGEELETTNEELHSTVEELETTNEELQSTNEELETMNEELQSSNEELQTMNEELRHRGHDLSKANSFLGGLLSALHCGVAVLDKDLIIEAWSPRMIELSGISHHDAVSSHFLNLEVGFATPKVRSDLRVCAAAEIAKSIEQMVEYKDPRGNSVNVMVTVASVRGSDAQGVLIVVEERL